MLLSKRFSFVNSLAYRCKNYSLKAQTGRKQLKAGDVAFLGVPFDENSSFLQGPARGPAEIREALHCGSANYFSEDGTDLANCRRFFDVGDVDFLRRSGKEDWLGTIEVAAEDVLATGAKLLALGGDHSVTWPLIRAHSKYHSNLTVLHIDAHPDLYHELDGNPHSHACPFARIMEEGWWIVLFRLAFAH